MQTAHLSQWLNGTIKHTKVNDRVDSAHTAPQYNCIMCLISVLSHPKLHHIPAEKQHNTEAVHMRNQQIRFSLGHRLTRVLWQAWENGPSKLYCWDLAKACSRCELGVAYVALFVFQAAIKSRRECIKSFESVLDNVVNPIECLHLDSHFHS